MNKKKYLKIYNPYTNKEVGKVLLSEKDKIDEFINLAYNFRYEINYSQRAEILKRCSDFYKKNIQTEAKLISDESGICIKQAIYEVNRTINALNYSKLLAEKLVNEDLSKDYIYKSDQNKAELSVVRESYDLALAITPFNHPLNQVVHKVAPAIVAGTPIIVKPSEKTPLSAYRLSEILIKCGLPKYALIVLNGICLKTTVKQLVTSRMFDVISFTGSVKVGKIIESLMIESENYLKKYVPELGGNASFVVDKDSDLNLASEIALSAFDNSGQRCTSIKRILVFNEIAEKFIEKFIEKTKKLKYGNPYDISNDLGSLIDSDSAELIKLRVDDAIKKGAILKYGNIVEGALYSPTIIDNVKHNMILVKEETFGPIAPIIRVDTIDDCISIVNSSSFGLAGAICTNSKKTAKYYFDNITVGQFSWNGAPGYRTENAPFGGYGCSGNGEKEGIIHATKGLARLRTFYKH